MALPESYDREQVDTHLTQRLSGLKIEFGTILNDVPSYLVSNHWTPPCCMFICL